MNTENKLLELIRKYSTDPNFLEKTQDYIYNASEYNIVLCALIEGIIEGGVKVSEDDRNWITQYGEAQWNNSQYARDVFGEKLWEKLVS